ncbi:M23 family metallopeptidase [Candidatus Palauibacter sp.]|uniref:M23 family metallopeptidase n=1 Tax=Candidatus Palauibacter sp. TaxID=3101350 RepID=UPI003AF26F7E
MTRLNEWTLQLVRRDGRKLRAVALGRARLLFAAAGTGLGLMALGVLLGLFWATRSESSRIAELESELGVLRGERARVNELAARLAEIEQGVGVLRDAVTEGRPEAEAPANIVVRGSSALRSRPDPESETPAWPLAQRGFITRQFGSRPATSREGHTGLDIAAPTGSYVRAIQAGRVEEAGEDPVYGKFLRIAHTDGLTSLYGHNSWLFATVGETVERLEVIALTGNTGRSSAPHLHLELLRNGSLVDPLTVVADHSVRGGAEAPTDTEPR